MTRLNEIKRRMDILWSKTMAHLHMRRRANNARLAKKLRRDNGLNLYFCDSDARQHDLHKEVVLEFARLRAERMRLHSPSV